MSKKKRNVPALVTEVLPSPNHTRWAEAYVRLGSIKGACQETGYSEHYGKELILHPEIVREVARLRERLQTACEFSLEKAFEQGQRLLYEFERTGQGMACARMYELTSKMVGHLSDRPPEKPTVNVRQAVEDAHDAEAMRTAWKEFLTQWKQRTLHASEREGQTYEHLHDPAS